MQNLQQLANRINNQINNGKYKLAERNIKKLTKYKPFAVSAKIFQAKLDIKKKNYLKAKEYLLSVTNSQESKNLFDAYFELAKIYLLEFNYEQAESYIIQCIDIVPDNIDALGLYTDILRVQQRYNEASNIYKQFHQKHQLSGLGYSRFMECLAFIGFEEYSKDLEEIAYKFLQQTNVNHTKQTLFISRLLCLKYKLQDNNQGVSLDIVLEDDFFHLALQKIFFADPDIEIFITLLRKELLISSLEQSAVNKDYIPLMAGIAQQCFNNEYVNYVTDYEIEMLEAVIALYGSVISNKYYSTQELETLLLIIGMYRGISTLEHAQKLCEFSLEEWTEKVQPFVLQTLHNPLIEQQDKVNIPRLNIIEDDTSCKVKNQYESNPYPRWLTVENHEPVALHTYLQFEGINIEEMHFQQHGKAKVLVAGCGTGKQPLQFALMMKDIEITAVDLSLSSLAYARRKAQEYGVNNIKFMQADILELGKLQEQFDVIACSGVLHHMQDPMQGWQVLCGLLKDKGVMNIALYSELGRRHVIQARNLISGLNSDVSENRIRVFRQGVMQGKLGNEVRERLIKSNDFYNLSGCRDLLFHVQEHRYTIPKLQQSLDELSLEMLGFDSLKPYQKQNYLLKNPDDHAMKNLGACHIYEIANPDLFANMYGFWCQKKLTAKKDQLAA